MPPKYRDVFLLSCVLLVFCLASNSLFGAEVKRLIAAEQPAVQVSLQDKPVLQLGKYANYLRDPSGRMTLEQVQGKLAQPLWMPTKDSAASIGETHDTIWFYGRFLVPVTDNNLWYFEVGNSSLGQVDVQFFQQGILIKRLLSSTDKDFSAREISSPTHATVMALQPGLEYQYFARIESATFIDFPGLLQPLNHYLGPGQATLMQSGLFYGVLLAVLFYYLVFFIRLKDVTYIDFTFFVISCGLFFSSIDGLGFYYLWAKFPSFNNYATAVFAGLASVTGAQLARSFLNLKKYFPRWNRAYYVAICLGMMLLISMAILPAGIMVIPVTMMATILFPSFLIIGVIAWRQGIAYASYFTVSWLVSSLVYLWFALSLLGYSTTSADVLVDILGAVFLLQLTLLMLALGARVAFLNTEKDSAQAQNRAKSRMIAQVSHELRTPMNGILGMSELLAQRPLDDTSKHYNDIIHQSAGALLGVINDLLDVAKIEADKLTLNEKPANLYQLCKDALHVIEPQVAGRDIKLLFNYDASLPHWFVCDETRLRQVLVNFLNNAQKFTQQGSITIDVKPSTAALGSIDIAVVDSGSGIAAELRPNLFLAFSQDVSDADKAQQGTGLGLFISDRLARLMNGSINFSTELEVGSRFWISVPLNSCAPLRSDDGDNDTPSLPLGLRVLVAEDNSVNQMVITRLLENNGCPL